MTRPARVIIDPQAARHNLQIARRRAGSARVMAVIKADAYGHGIVRMAELFADADAFAVASLDEAEQLRQAGVEHPVVLLEGPFEAAELGAIRDLKLEIVVHAGAQIRMLEASGMRLPVWIKCDTGMHRLGFGPHSFDEAVARLAPHAEPLRFMTHFANAHVREHPSIGQQIAQFERMLGTRTGERSLANSGALLTAANTVADWVRPGLMLYGVSPLHDEAAISLDLQPVMTLRSRLISVREVAAGESIGYGASFQCPRPMKVGVVAYGYGDGYPRHAGTGTPVLVKGVRTRVIGECSMDMMTVDLTSVPDAEFGDPVTLWGRDLPIETVAAACGTIPYELLCRVRMRAHYELATA